MDLVADLGNLLCWSTEVMRLEWLRRRYEDVHGQSISPVTRQDMIVLIETHAGQIDKDARQITQSLHRWLIEIA